MLEQPSLLLRPWVHSFELFTARRRIRSAGWARTIANPSTERSLGQAVWDAGGLFGMLSWLGRKRIQVYESDDDSLLVTLYRSWGLSRSWEFRDADERHVGCFLGDAIYDGFGARLATMSIPGDGSESVLRGDHGAVIGSWQDIPGQGRYFRFGEGLENTPFVRMAALAAVLSLPPWPGDVALAIRPAV